MDLDLVLALTSLGFCAAALFFSWGYVREVLRARGQDRWIEHGEPAEGMILKLSETGRMHEHRHVIQFDVDVRRPGEAPYRATAYKPLSARLDAGRYWVGMTVPLKINPADPRQIAILDPDEHPVPHDVWRR
jgi:hypothetical protein